MKLNLEDWEVGMILSALEEIPPEESSETIRRIREQIEPELIRCRDCERFEPEKRNPVAQMFRELLWCGDQKGICRRTNSPTESNGYCHKAKRRQNDS